MSSYPTPPRSSSPRHSQSQSYPQSYPHSQSPPPPTSKPKPTTTTASYSHYSPPKPYRRTGSPGTNSPPIIYRLPSPYNASRPQPRPGFIARMLGKLLRLLTRIKNYGRKHPIVMGLLTAVPVITAGFAIRAGKGIMRLMGGGGGKGSNAKGMIRYGTTV